MPRESEIAPPTRRQKHLLCGVPAGSSDFCHDGETLESPIHHCFVLLYTNEYSKLLLHFYIVWEWKESRKLRKKKFCFKPVTLYIKCMRWDGYERLYILQNRKMENMGISVIQFCIPNLENMYGLRGCCSEKIER